MLHKIMQYIDTDTDSDIRILYQLYALTVWIALKTIAENSLIQTAKDCGYQ